MNELINLLQGDNGLPAQIVAWMGALRVPLKLVSGKVQDFLTKLVAYVQGTPELDDDLMLSRVLSSRWYRVLVFILDYAGSIKLPTADSLKKIDEEEPKS